MNVAAPALTPALSAKQFLVKALLGCLLGTLIGLLNVFLLAGLVSSNSELIEPAVCGLCGIIAGAIQGNFLRRTTRPALLWLLLNGAGWSVIGFIDAHHLIAWSTTGDQMTGALLLGAVAALPQWLLLQRSLRFAALWLPLSASTWSILLVLIDWQQDFFREMFRWIINQVL